MPLATSAAKFPEADVSEQPASYEGRLELCAIIPVFTPSAVFVFALITGVFLGLRCGVLAFTAPTPTMSALTPVIIYTFGSSDQVFDFYLAKESETRFKTRSIRDLPEMNGQSLLGSIRKSFERSPQQTLLREGYRIGREYRDGFDGLLFPLWRR